MTKRLSILLMTVLLSAASLWACPALQGTRRVQQPDGTFVTIRLIGDEYRHYNTTADGYTLVRNAEGYYVYARQDATGQLAPTALIAHDAAERTAADMEYLQRVGRIVPPVSASMEQIRQQDQTARSRALAARKASMYDYSKFRGLVILVEYNDCEFRYDDYQEIMNHMINDDDYQGEARTNIASLGVKCTGSMRDFYRDNSNGVFLPTFDVVGPVKINRSQYYSDVNKGDYDFTKTKNSVQLVIDACTAADSQVNFADYDVNNDGSVDMIYFIFSGLPSYIQGNDERLLWPHQYDVRYLNRYVRKDGVYLGRYACSTELFGTEGESVLEGIGTLCHEFTHVLGLPDFYDTDNAYPEPCENPQGWSIMASADGNNYGRTPVGFSLFERYALGFAQPQVIGSEGDYSLEAISSSNTGFRLNTPKQKEFFLLENRQKVKWDAYLPGHGMLIWRVDSTNTQAWQNNTVNDNPSHPYYQLVRAKGQKKSGSNFIDSTTDPFPGTGHVTMIDNQTSPANLLTWNKMQSPFGLRNITEKDGVISFTAFNALSIQSVSLPTTLNVAKGMSIQLTPEWVPDYVEATFQWSSDNEAVATVDATGLLTAVEQGVAHITVTANEKVSATCEVTVIMPPVIDDIASFKSQDEGVMAFLTLNDAQVLYATASDLYIRDASGCIVLRNTPIVAERNDILRGSVGGSFLLENGMPVLRAVDGLTNTSSLTILTGETAEPRLLHASQLGADYYADLVKVQKVEIVRDGNVFAEFGGRRFRLWNTFQISNPKITLPSNTTGKRYDILAIFGTNTLSNGNFTEELCLLKSPEQVSFTALETLGFSETTLYIEPESTAQLMPILSPANADAFLSWSSDNEEVATVDGSGLVTVLAEGTAVITVNDMETGLQASCTITTEPSGIVEITPNSQHQIPNIFDLNGRRLGSTPTYGFYLMRQNGRFVKIMK